MIKVNIDELQETISILLTKLKEKEGLEIKLKNDYYWNIDSEELYNVYEQPKDLSIGQLSFDWEHIANVKVEEIIPYEFLTVSSILRALGNEYPVAF